MPVRHMTIPIVSDADSPITRMYTRMHMATVALLTSPVHRVKSGFTAPGLYSDIVVYSGTASTHMILPRIKYINVHYI